MKKIVLLMSLLALAGCKSHHTRDWYDKHPKERKAMVKKCSNDAALASNPDCANAINSDALTVSNSDIKKWNDSWKHLWDDDHHHSK